MGVDPRRGKRSWRVIRSTKTETAIGRGLLEREALDDVEDVGSIGAVEPGEASILLALYCSWLERSVRLLAAELEELKARR